jgi:hypothetical protein
MHRVGPAALRAYCFYLAISHPIIVLSQLAPGKDPWHGTRHRYQLIEPGVVAVQRWRPDTEAEAEARSAM